MRCNLFVFSWFAASVIAGCGNAVVPYDAGDASDAQGAPRATLLAIGGGATCARMSDQSVWCWGATPGAMPPGRSRPRRLAGLASVNSLALGDDSACAWMTDLSVRCWGVNDACQLGNGSQIESAAPTEVVWRGMPFRGGVGIGAGDQHYCVLNAQRHPYCWGLGASGQLGAPITRCQNEARAVDGIAEPLLTVSGGAAFTCALDERGSVWCWGDNTHGQLGDGTLTSRETPAVVSGLGTIRDLSTGYQGACASDGSVRCWGQYNINERRSAPEPAILSGVTQVSGSLENGCAVLRDATAWCWGDNGAGQLGDGTREESRTGVRVRDLNGVVQVVATTGHACARLDDGTVWCWGFNGNGQLGDGTFASRAVPARVVFE